MTPDVRAGWPGDVSPAHRLAELAEVGVRAVRLQYADLHGICRGKDIPISAFPHASEEGIGFVAAIMTVDLRHNVVAGFEQGFPDILARPGPQHARPPALAARRRGLPGRPRGPGHRRALAGWTRAARSSASCGSTRRSASRRSSGPSWSSTCCEADPLRRQRLPALRRSGQPGVHRRGRRRSQGNARTDARRGGRARPAGDRRRPRVRARPVRDQPAPRAGARFRRPRLPLQGDGQGDGRARRAAGHLHG